LVVLRVNYVGHPIVETVTGEQAGPDAPLLWTVLRRGHMRVVVPPPGFVGRAWLKESTMVGGPVCDAPALGWEFYYDRASSDPPTAPGSVATGCRCCFAAKTRQAARPRLVGAEAEPELVPPVLAFRVGSVLTVGAMADAITHVYEDSALAGGDQAMQLPGADQWVQEVGTALVSEAWERLGLSAAEPRGLRGSAVVLRNLASDPNGPNVWILAAHGLTFEDEDRTGEATRSFDEVEGPDQGRGVSPSEIADNADVALLADLVHRLQAAGKFVYVDGLEGSGKRPKVWDQPSWASAEHGRLMSARWHPAAWNHEGAAARMRSLFTPCPSLRETLACNPSGSTPRPSGGPAIRPARTCEAIAACLSTALAPSIAPLGVTGTIYPAGCPWLRRPEPQRGPTLRTLPTHRPGMSSGGAGARASSRRTAIAGVKAARRTRTGLTADSARKEGIRLGTSGAPTGPPST